MKPFLILITTLTFCMLSLLSAQPSLQPYSVPSQPNTYPGNSDCIFELHIERTVPSDDLASNLLRTSRAPTIAGSNPFYSAMILIEKNQPLASRVNDIHDASDLLRRAMNDDSLRNSNLADDIILAWGRLAYFGHLLQLPLGDSLATILGKFWEYRGDISFDPYLRNSKELFVIDDPSERTDEAGLYTLFSYYVGGAWSFAAEPRYPYDSVRAVGTSFLQKYPTSAYAGLVRALLFLLRIRSLTPDATFSEWKQLQNEIDPANARGVYAQLGDYMRNRGRYDLIDSLATELATRFSSTDYYREGLLYASSLHIQRTIPLESPFWSTRWQEKTIKVSLRAADGQSPLRENERSDFSRCLAIWQHALSAYQIRFDTASSAAEAMIQVEMYDSNYVLGGNPSWAGYASVGSSPLQSIFKADVKIRRGFSPADQRKTILHELGHALGLGHSLNRNDIMFLTTFLNPQRDVESAFSGRDSSTISLVYGAPRIEGPLNPIIRVTNGTSHTFEIIVSDPDGNGDIDSVFANLRSVGGHWKQPLRSDGLGRYTISLPVEIGSIPYETRTAIWFASKDKRGAAVIHDHPNFWIIPAPIVVAPTAPTLLSPSNGATGVSTSPTLSWNASTGATSYQLQVSTSSTFSTTVFDQSNITSTSQQVSGLANNTLYYWRVNATNAGGTSSYSNTWSFTTTAPTFVEQLGSDIPITYALYQNYPNPFNPFTTIQFSIPKHIHVRLAIFNSLGMEIEVLLNQHLPPGQYRIQWTPRDLASGVYFYQLRSSDFTETKKLLLLR